MTDSIESEVSKQLERMRSEGKLQVTTNRRCRICRDDDVRKVINTLHGYGLTTRSIVEVVDSSGLNNGRGDRDKITYDVIWRHTKKHFDIDTPAREIYRGILARRAAEEGQDIDQGVGSAVNALSYLETMMMRGYQDLVDQNTRIPYADGAKAAIKLHELTRRDAGVHEIAEVMRKMNYVINAVMTAVPEQYHADILSIMEGRDLTQKAVTATPQDLEGQAFDPAAFADDDDEDDD